MSRLKLFAHILLIKKSGSTLSPMRALIELNHDLISENDAFILGDQSGPGGPGGRGGPGSGTSELAEVSRKSAEICENPLKVRKQIRRNYMFI